MSISKMQPSTPSQKELLRAEAKEWRSHLSRHDVQRVSRTIAEELEGLLDWSAVETIHTYVAITTQNEIDTSTFLHWLWTEQSHVRVFTGVAEVFPIDQHTRFVVGDFGVPIPRGVASLSDVPIVDVAIVPCLLVSPDGQRIGYGKGQMDSFLTAHTPKHSIGLCYRQNTREALPQEDHDVVLDSVVII